MASGPWRMPAEWEPHESTWLVWPHAETTWPTVGLEAAEAFFCDAVRLIGEVERVDLVVRDPNVRRRATRELRRAGVPLEPVRFHEIATNDSWVRDFGPTWRLDETGRRSAACWQFNAWGGKYPPYDADAAAGEQIAAIAAEGCPEELQSIAKANFVLEGGSFDVDGRGNAVVTESCLLNPNRGVGLSRSTVERRLRDWIGVRDVLWLAGGVVGDDTDGHVDDCARFAEDGGLIIAVECDRSDANCQMLEENRARASEWAGRREIPVHELPMPEPVEINGDRLPASYANFLVCNSRVLVPTFGNPRDDDALAVVQAAFPTREIREIRSRDIVEGLGSIHCLSQQLPTSVEKQQAIGLPRNFR